MQGTQKGGRKNWLPNVKGGCARPFAPLKRGVSIQERVTYTMNIEDAPEILRHCHYTEHASHVYDILRGGFIWEDEFPNEKSDLRGFLQSIALLSKVIAYRASLTLGEPNPAYENEWNTLKRLLPSWPGFREERIYGTIERELRLIRKQEKKCLQRREEELR